MAAVYFLAIRFRGFHSFLAGHKTDHRLEGEKSTAISLPKRPCIVRGGGEGGCSTQLYAEFMPIRRGEDLLGQFPRAIRRHTVSVMAAMGVEHSVAIGVYALARR
jgi:hypothetical protein